MLERAKALLQPSVRSNVPPFMVMDVMAAAARLEAQGRTIVHMEVGQPAAGAPSTAIAAVRAALGNGPHGYTATLGIAPMRRNRSRS
jgi:aspartate/methionine/tyrosine aminotransferase